MSRSFGENFKNPTPEQKELDRKLNLIDSRFIGGYIEFYNKAIEAGYSVPKYWEIRDVKYPVSMAGGGFSFPSLFDPTPTLIPNAPRYMEEAAERERQRRIQIFNSQIQNAFRTLQNIQNIPVPIGGIQTMYKYTMNVAMEYIINNFGTYENFRQAAQARNLNVPSTQPTYINDAIIDAIDNFIARPYVPEPTRLTPIDPNFRFLGLDEWSRRQSQSQNVPNVPNQHQYTDMDIPPSNILPPNTPNEYEENQYEREREQKEQNRYEREREQKEQISIPRPRYTETEREQKEQKEEKNDTNFQNYISGYRNRINQSIAVHYQTVIARMIISILTPTEYQTINEKKQSGIRVPNKLKRGQNWNTIKSILQQLLDNRGYDRAGITEAIMRVLFNNNIPIINRKESMVNYTNRVFGNMPAPQIQNIVNEIIESLRQTIPEIGNAYELLNLSVEAPQIMPTFDVNNPAIRTPAIEGLIRLGLSNRDAQTIYDRIYESVIQERQQLYARGNIDYQQAQDNSRETLFRQLDDILSEIERLSKTKIKMADLKIIFEQILEGFNLKYTMNNIPTIISAVGQSDMYREILQQLEPDARGIQPPNPNEVINQRQINDVMREAFGYQIYQIVNTRYFKIFRNTRVLDDYGLPIGMPLGIPNDEPPNDPPLYTIVIGQGEYRRRITNINMKTLGIILGMLVAAGGAIKVIYKIIKAIREEHSLDTSLGIPPSVYRYPNEPSDIPLGIPIPKEPYEPNTERIRPMSNNLINFDIPNISKNKNFNDTNIINIGIPSEQKNMMKKSSSVYRGIEKTLAPMAPITGQILPNSGGAILPKKAVTMDYTQADPFRAMLNPNPFDDNRPIVYPVGDNGLPIFNLDGTVLTPTTDLDISKPIDKPPDTPTPIGIPISDTSDTPIGISEPYDYKTLGMIQLYIHETTKKIASGKYSKQETDYMKSEISNANTKIKSMLDLGKSEKGTYRDTTFKGQIPLDTVYDQDKSGRQKAFYEQSIALENNFQESKKEYEAELARLKMMYKDPMLSSSEVSSQKMRVDELKAALSKTKNEYDDTVKVIAYGNQNQSNLNIPNDITPSNVSQATIYNQIQQLESNLKKSNPQAFNEYSDKVKNMWINTPNSLYNNYFENRLASIQNIYKTNNLVEPDISNINITPLSELVSDDADTIVQFNKDKDVRLDQGSGTRRIAVKDPAEVRLFLNDDASTRKQQVMFESFSRVAPGHGLGTMAFNKLRQHNAKTDRLQYAHTLQEAPRYNPNLTTPTMMYPTKSQIDKQDLELKKEEYYNYQDSVRGGPTQQPFIPVYQSDYGKVSWEEDTTYGNQTMGVNRTKSTFTPERINSNVYSDYDNPSSIYHPELALRNSLYRPEIFRPVEIKETKQQGYYMGLPSNMRPSQQSNILIANDKTGIDYTPIMRNDMFDRNSVQVQKSNIDNYKQPIKGLVDRQKKMFNFQE